MRRLSTDWIQRPEAQSLLGLLEEEGHQAFFVGGCVRNALLGEPVSDLDIATDAEPERMTQLANSVGMKVIPTGVEHGTVTVLVDSTPFEVTTFRKDIETDGRHANVQFSDSMGDDAERRDFTMNALYVDRCGELFDPVGGLKDLEARRIRFIGNAEERITEDYLRILRFFRFHAWYGSADEGIDADGLAACAANIDGLDRLSKERIGHEMRKLLSAPNPAPAASSMAACGALARVLPGANAVGLALLTHIENDHSLAPDAMRRLAVLGGEDSVRDLRLSRAETRQLEIIKSADAPIALGYRYDDAATDIIAVRSAIMGVDVSKTDLEEARAGIGQEFPVSAADLMPDFQGPALGEALKRLEQRWIDSRFELSKAELVASDDIQE